MSMFTLAIFCLTTYNLPWFMDLTFQVPMQYFSLQLRTLLPSPVISTTGCFCFGSVSSFFLELFLHWSPVAYWAPREFIFQCPIFFPFHTLHGVLKARILEWVAIYFSRGSSQPRDQTWVSRIVGRCFTLWESRQIGSGHTGDGKSEHRHSRNQRIKMDWNGWI